MGRLNDVQTFIDHSRLTEKPAELFGLLAAISSEMRFDHFALVHHVDLRSHGTLHEHTICPDYIALSNYPQAWIDQYIGDEIVSSDPVLLASQRTNVGFGWDQVPQMITVTAAHRDITERTRKAGICDGFTVPANIPGQLNGSCNFAVGPAQNVPQQNFPMAQLIGSFAFEAASKLVARMRNIPADEPVRLTQRQLECIVLVARGKSDWEIGKILGLSPATVTAYMQDARERYDVPKRIQVVMRALYDGAIPFSELF